MKRILRRRVGLFVLCFASIGLLPYLCLSQSFAPDDRIWTRMERSSLDASALKRVGLPGRFEAFRLDASQAAGELARVSGAPDGIMQPIAGEFTLPMPDGNVAAFRITESPVVQPAMLKKYPSLRTYVGQGISDPTATARFDFINGVFRAIVSGKGGTYLVEPFGDRTRGEYISFFLHDVPEGQEEFWCGFNAEKHGLIDDPPAAAAQENSLTAGEFLRTYVVAIATTAEWTDLMGGGTVEGGLARVVSIVNRMNLIYERDAAIRFVLAADNDQVIFAGNSPYDDSDLIQMMVANESVLRSRLAPGYDVGHVFGTNSNTGLAGVAGGLACTSGREAGASKITSEFGFDLLTPVHELAHQMNALHIFNRSATGRSASSAFEPNFGASIMAIGGGAVRTTSFHVKTIETINEFAVSGPGVGCADLTPTGNAPPSVTAASGFNIPKGTPFFLTAAASDIDGDPLTFDWQEYDLGPASPPDNDLDGSPRPIFRVFDPVSDPTRFFPSLPFIRFNGNVPPNGSEEVLPGITRTMNFQVIVRDNRPGSGAVNTAFSTVNVDGGSGPFVVTAPAGGETVASGGQFLVTWDVAGTTNAPVSAANVDVLLSTDGGLTFPTTLAAATANDGSETVTLPSLASPIARVMVRGTGNIFFDMSDANFAIADCEAGECAALSISPASSNIPRGGSIGFSSSGGTGAHTFSFVANASLGTIDPASGNYVAGPAVGTDIIRVTDSAGATADAVVNTSAACVDGEKTWDGGGSTENWSEAANWTCDEVPASDEVVIFDPTSSQNVTVDVHITLDRLRIDAGFDGTITIPDGTDVTISGEEGFTQSDGEVNIGSGTFTTGVFRLEAGRFNAGSGTTISVLESFVQIQAQFNLDGTLLIHRDASQGPGASGSNTGTVRLVGADEGSFSLTNLNNLEVDASSAKKIQGAPSVSGTLRLVNGGVTGGEIRALNGITIESTFEDAAGSGVPTKIVIAGSGSGSYVNNGGSNPSGEWVVDGFILLASDLDLSSHNDSPLRLTSGRIIGDNFTVNTGTRDILRTGGHINGALRRDFTATGPKEFALGRGGSFTPVTANVTNVASGTGGLTVRFTPFPHPSMNQLLSLECHWVVAEHGDVTADLNFTYTDTCDINGIENSASVARVAAGTVSFTGDTVSAATNTFSIAGETEFVSYSIGIDPSPCAAALRTWDGGGATSNWSDAANWTCDVLPQSGVNVVFDDTSSDDVVIDVPLNAAAFRIEPGYTGTITMGNFPATIRDFTQGGGSFAGSGGTIDVTGAFVFNAGSFDAASGQLTISGNFAQNGGTFRASSGTSSLFGSFLRTGGTFVHNDGTFEMRGENNATFNQGRPDDNVETFANFRIQKTGIASVTVTGRIQVTGDVDLASGQLLPGQNSPMMFLEGDAVIGPDFNGLLTTHYVGTGDQTVTQSPGSSNNPWSFWGINKPGGRVILLSDVRFNNSSTFVFFENGLVVTGEFTLDLTTGGSSSSNGYVIGNLRQTVILGAVFDVGTETGYSPVFIENAGAGSVITVKANDGQFLGVDPSRSIARHWTITSDGAPATGVHFLYNDADVPAGANESEFMLVRRSEGVNLEFVPSAFDPDGNVMSLTGDIFFSDWTIGRVAGPTSAPAEITGRVVDANGRGIRRAFVEAVSTDGEVSSTFTNTFGYYRIDGLQAGESYVVSATAKRYTFIDPVRFVTLTADLAGLDFVARRKGKGGKRETAARVTPAPPRRSR